MDEELKPLTPEEARRENEKCGGAPKYFTYPAPLPISEERRRYYEEIMRGVSIPKRRQRRRRQ